MAMRKAGRRSTENGMVRALRTRNRDGPVAPDKPDDDDGGAGDTLEVAGESDYVAPKAVRIGTARATHMSNHSPPGGGGG